MTNQYSKTLNLDFFRNFSLETFYSKLFIENLKQIKKLGLFLKDELRKLFYIFQIQGQFNIYVNSKNPQVNYR